MNIKQHLRNVLVSFLSVIIFDFLYGTIGVSLVINNLKIRDIRIVTVAIAVGLLCVLLCAGYLIGKFLLSQTEKRHISIVIIPMILLLLLFGVGMIAPVINIMMLLEHPIIALSVPLGFGKYLDAPIPLFVTFILFHLLLCCSLFIGSYHKKQK